jgi:hypothetical protein
MKAELSFNVNTEASRRGSGEVDLFIATANHRRVSSLYTIPRLRLQDSERVKSTSSTQSIHAKVCDFDGL